MFGQEVLISIAIREELRVASPSSLRKSCTADTNVFRPSGVEDVMLIMTGLSEELLCNIALTQPRYSDRGCGE